MSNRDIGVVAQTTSGILPGEDASTSSPMPPRRLDSRTHSHISGRPRWPPERPFNKPGNTHSDSRQRREGQENSAGSVNLGGPPSPASKRPSGQDSARAPRRIAAATPLRHATHADLAIQSRTSSHAIEPVSNARQLPALPKSNSLPADRVEHGPSDSTDDTRAEMARAKEPHDKRAQLESRQRQLKGMETQKGPSAQLHSTSGVVSIDSPGGESGAEKPIEHLSKTSLDKSGLHDSDPEQQSQIQSNKQEQLLKRNP